MSTDRIVICSQYRYYGEKVVSACIEAGADHVDISGEPQYLEQAQLNFSEQAREKGVHVVGSCGFDSVPAELGTLYLQEIFPGKSYIFSTYGSEA